MNMQAGQVYRVPETEKWRCLGWEGGLKPARLRGQRCSNKTAGRKRRDGIL